ncbi:hypothetical protein ACIQYF_07780 [Pseudomonas sp. NPDC096917]|uniref:hypothetical protein n=1 Tax=Pseudomonas sp. NPDC096917 TaxID=3364483 RepID=UPI00383A7C53
MPKSLIRNAVIPLTRLFLASAIAMTVSVNVMAAPSPQSTTTGEQWQGNYDGACNANEAMISSSRDGDENIDPIIKCAAYAPYGVAGTMVPYKAKEEDNGNIDDDIGNWSDVNIEGGDKGHTYICPDNTVMTAIRHRNDENGQTYYRCSKFLINNVVTKLIPGTTLKFKESDHDVACPTGQVMIGRSHLCDSNDDKDKCDENASSEYTCGYVRAIQ